ncbi:MAG: hypothetical protein FWD57_07205, partial [Polyangiaceae bacterium]|nr:hypothetical protein [Polyangiaceae bacterium]
MSWARRIIPNLLVGLGLLTAAGGILTARVLDQGERELKTAQALTKAGDLEQAIVHARQSAMWMVPGAPHVPAAYFELIELAKTAEGRGDTKTALFAWQSVRTSVLSTRWVVVPHKHELLLADASIARLSSTLPPTQGAAMRDPADIERKMQTMLSRNDRPRVPWVMVLLGGFVGLSVGFVHMGVKVQKVQGFGHLKALRVGAII